MDLHRFVLYLDYFCHTKTILTIMSLNICWLAVIFSEEFVNLPYEFSKISIFFITTTSMIDGVMIAKHAIVWKPDEEILEDVEDPDEDSDDYSWNQIFMYSCTVLALMAGIFQMVHLIFGPSNESEKPSTSYLGILPWVVPLVVIFPWKVFKYVLGKLLTGLDLVSTLMILGYANVAICFVMIMWENVDRWTPLRLCMLLNAILTFYYSFIHIHRKTVYLNYRNHGFSIFIIGVVYFTGVIAAIRYNFSTDDTCRESQELLVIAKVLIAFLNAPSFIDFGVLVAGGLRQRHNFLEESESLEDFEGSEAVHKTTNNTVSSERTYPKITCNSCSDSFSTTNIPKILSNCGHSMCEQCMDGKFKNQNTVLCGVCKKDSSKSDMLKNFTLLEIVEDLERLNNDN